MKKTLVATGMLSSVIAAYAGAGAWLERRLPELLPRLRRLEARYYARQGHQCAVRGDLRSAIGAYHAAIAVDGEFASLYFHLGYAYERLSRWSGPTDPGRAEALRRAVVCHRRVAEREPRLRRRALSRLAVLHGPGELDEPALLEAELDQLVRLDPLVPDQALALARLREDAGRLAEAEATLLRAREALAGEAVVHRELARFYRRHEELDASMAALEHRLASAPEDREALFALVEGCFYRAFRDHRIGAERRLVHIRRGLSGVGRLLRLDPDHGAARRYRALLLRLEAEHAGADS